MAEGLRGKKAAVAGGEDRLSALPEELIHLVLSLLPSCQAVRTCALAARWRTLWKSVPSLRVNADDEAYHSCQDLKRFIDSFLGRRDPTAPLHECEVLFDHHRDTEEFHQDFHMWLSYAVSRKARVLRFEILAGHDPLQLPAGALVSDHLTTLILRCVQFEDFSLDVSGCQSLEVLEMHECVINIGAALPKSLRHLTIRDTCFGPQDTRCLTSAPGLVSLEVADCDGWTPLFKSLPSLEAALIDTRYILNGSCGYCGHELCVVCHRRDDCVFLEGLSGAKNLELIADYVMVYRMDMKWYPTFSKLKTLLLGHWCMADDFYGLIYFLKNSPILERFTLELYKPFEHAYGIVNGTYQPEDQVLVSKHLKAFEINHVKDDKWIHLVLKPAHDQYLTASMVIPSAGPAATAARAAWWL
ncbi:hypothetical protein D1007_60049 [Hordeum vulgare]|nr:hypothetical protein D1007_60049 [Hordeum vulgare]